ncbi:MAG TPA: class I SAM-dependent methyltransferase [Solirubrobacteraceae bacterium]
MSVEGETGAPRWPEHLPQRAHPSQGVRHALAERLARRNGLGLTRIFSAAVGRQRVDRVAQLARDFGPDVARPLRVLDPGAGDGAFAVRLAEDGADVVAVDGRAEHVARIRALVQEHDASVMVIHSDVRDLRAEHAAFDVVLCLGLLYHLPLPDVFRLVEYVAHTTRHLAIFETQISLAPKHSAEHRGATYFGDYYREDTSQPGASLDNPASFWLTRPSLLNLLNRSGFTSVAEALNPPVPELAAYTDHMTLIARKG